MFRPRRPVFGRFIFLAATTSVAFSFLAGCGKKEVATDSWRLSQPSVELMDTADGKVRNLEFSKLKNGGDIVAANETAVLRFAPVDANLAMNVKSQCETGSDRTDEFITSGQTGEAVSILTMLPPAVLRPDSLKKEWLCRINVQVGNAAGSTHQFSLSNFKINLASASDRIMNSAAKSLPNDRGAKSAVARRLVCGTWWLDLPAGSDLSDSVRAEKVNGTDSRLTDRQPLCSVLELSQKRMLTGFFTPNFGAAPLAWTAKSLVLASTADQILHHPLVEWEIRNDSTVEQIAFIAVPTAGVRISGLTSYPQQQGPPFWSLANPARAVFSVQGAESLSTARGLYFYIAAKGAVKLTMASNFQHTTCGHKMNGVSQYALSADSPLRLMTLANTSQIANPAKLASADGNKLDQIVRDTTEGGTPSLLSAMHLKRVDGTDGFAITEASAEQIASMGLPGADSCLHGDMIIPLDIMNPVMQTPVGR